MPKLDHRVKWSYPSGQSGTVQKREEAGANFEAQTMARNGATCEVWHVDPANGERTYLRTFSPRGVPSDLERDLIRTDVLSDEELNERGWNTADDAPERQEHTHDEDTPPLEDFRRPTTTDKGEPMAADDTQTTAPHITGQRGITLAFDVQDFPVVEAENFKPVLAQTLTIALYRRFPSGEFYVGKIQLKGRAAKKDGTAANAQGNLWFHGPSEAPDWLARIVQEKAAPYLATTQADDTQCSGGAAIDHDETGICNHGTADTDGESLPIHAITDEELWNSPLGERLRNYADKLLAAEGERISLTDKRALVGNQRMGLDFARTVIHPTGEDVDTRNNAGEGDPWTYWQSPEVVGLREAVSGSDRTREGAQEAAKAYIASLQGEERPTADEEPTESADDEREWTPTDVAGALSFLLKGRALSDAGPFVVHEGDGFHREPYVILPLDAMAKVLDEIPGDRW